MENKIDIKKELILTLSNKKSLFSSKKLERFVVFYTFLIINVVFISMRMHKLEVMHLIEITAVWLAYAGFNTYQNYKDRKMEAGIIDEEQN